MPAPFCWAAWFGHGRPPTPYFSQPIDPQGLSDRPSVMRKGRHTASPSRARGLPNKTPSHKSPIWGVFNSFSTGPGRRSGGVPARTHDLEFFDLGVIELDRGRPAEDRDCDLEPGPFLVDVLDGAVERGEGAVG